MLVDVAAVAVSSVRVHLNNTAFPDDMLAHRIGLVPIVATRPRADPDPSEGGTPVRSEAGESGGEVGAGAESRAEDAGQGTNATPSFTLDASGPCDIYSEDFVATRPFGGPGATGPLLLDFVPGVFLCPLAAGQRLRLEAFCEIGSGADHARFASCVAPRYAARHVGVEAPECFCISTPYDSKCARCALYKPSIEACAGPLCHQFAFETTGGVTALVLLRRALLTLRAKLELVRDAT
jgi:hypothetical protein